MLSAQVPVRSNQAATTFHTPFESIRRPTNASAGGLLVVQCFRSWHDPSRTLMVEKTIQSTRSEPVGIDKGAPSIPEPRWMREGPCKIHFPAAVQGLS
jgi:hypothetical protein